MPRVEVPAAIVWVKYLCDHCKCEMEFKTMTQAVSVPANITTAFLHQCKSCSHQQALEQVYPHPSITEWTSPKVKMPLFNVPEDMAPFPDLKDMPLCDFTSSLPLRNADGTPWKPLSPEEIRELMDQHVNDTGLGPISIPHPAHGWLKKGF